MRALLICALGAALVVTATAQEQAKLSDGDALRVRLHQAEIALEQALANAAGCRAQLRSLQLTDEDRAIKADIEQRHPGYVIDMQTGQLRKVAADAP